METLTVSADRHKQHWMLSAYGQKPYTIWPQPDEQFEYIGRGKSETFIIYKGTIEEILPIVVANVAAYRARFRQPHISPMTVQRDHIAYINRPPEQDAAPMTTKTRLEILGAITIPPD